MRKKNGNGDLRLRICKSFIIFTINFIVNDILQNFRLIKMFA